MASNIGQVNTTSVSNDFNAISFVVSQILAGSRTVMLVQVLSVTNTGGVSPIGTVNVQPLVQQVNGVGEATPHGTVYNLPYMRIQGGTNAVILDPEVGDIGIICIADRDSSAALAAQGQATPGSGRKGSPSDGFYMMSVSGKTPTRYVQFTSSGITVNDPSTVTIIAPNTKIQGELEVTGAVTLDSTLQVDGAQTNNSTIVATGNITGQGTSLHTHVHSGVQTGGGTSGPPV